MGKNQERTITEYRSLTLRSAPDLSFLTLTSETEKSLHSLMTKLCQTSKMRSLRAKTRVCAHRASYARKMYESIRVSEMNTARHTNFRYDLNRSVQNTCA